VDLLVETHIAEKHAVSIFRAEVMRKDLKGHLKDKANQDK
jgi:hypothetical protein